MFSRSCCAQPRLCRPWRKLSSKLAAEAPPPYILAACSSGIGLRARTVATGAFPLKAAAPGLPAQREQQGSLDTVVNRAHYPDLADPELIHRCRSELAAHQTCRLPGFLTAEAIESMLAFATEELAATPHPGTSWANVYYQEPWSHPGFMDPERHRNHVLNRTTSRSNTYITAHHIPDWIPLRRLQDDKSFQTLLESATDQELIEYNCEVSKFVFSASKHGDHQGWHFDNNFLTLTFMLQAPDEGGLLEVYPRIGRENYEGIESILNTDQEAPSQDRGHQPIRAPASDQLPPLLRYKYEVGDMVLFVGRDSLHRSTEVRGGTARLIGIVSYNTSKERSLPNQVHMMKVYGLATPE